MPDVRTIVFGGKAKLSGLWVDDQSLRNYVDAHSDELIGFLSLDPTQDGWESELKIAHLGHPYEGECVAVIRKHPHVYADLSALHYRPFQLYHGLMRMQEYGVWDKVLFRTDYPFTTVQASIDGLRRLNGMLAGTALPRLNEEAIERLIFRDSLPLLGL